MTEGHAQHFWFIGQCYPRHPLTWAKWWPWFYSFLQSKISRATNSNTPTRTNRISNYLKRTCLLIPRSVYFTASHLNSKKDRRKAKNTPAGTIYKRRDLKNTCKLTPNNAHNTKQVAKPRHYAHKNNFYHHRPIINCTAESGYFPYQSCMGKHANAEERCGRVVARREERFTNFLRAPEHK